MEGLTVVVLLSSFFILTIILILVLKKNKSDIHSDKGTQIAVLKEKILRSEGEKNRLEEEVSSLKQTLTKLKEELEAKNRGIANLERQLAVSLKEIEVEREQSREKINLIRSAKEELSNQFKVLANSILDEKTRTFREQNANNMNTVLNPLKDKLGEFQKKIQEHYEHEGKERHSLQNEIRRLMELNHKLSQEASNLTKALKGESKVRGNWGEMILQRILEVSGLRKGEEYSTQESYVLDNGSRLQPDVVIHLPEDRYMVIDSKVSLNAYDEYISQEDLENKEAALKAHVASVRTHMKGLSTKEYHMLHKEKSPDFVIMFMPIEPAFILAISEDRKIWEDAWTQNILLVSPSTLLFVMRIVMQLWRQEHRSHNALEIARRGALLYDKLVSFVDDFESLGLRIEQAKKSFESAKGKLRFGKGNVIRQAERLKELGISTGKKLPQEYTDKNREND